MDRDRAHPRETPPNTPAIDIFNLFLISALLLFFELTVIRWIPASLRIVAYFSNLILVSCFLGFGLGCLLKKRRDLFPLFPLSVLILLLTCRFFSGAGIANPTDSSYFFGGSSQIRWIIGVPVIFVLNALPFMCIGQKLSAYFDRFRPLSAYSINVAGSLFGTVGFAAVSFFELRPTWWFLLSFAAALVFLRSSRILLVASVAVLFGAATAVYIEAEPHIWSPYYKISVDTLNPPSAGGQRVIVNHDYHQLILDLSGRWNDRLPDYRDWQLTYDFPYLALERHPGRVLVLGAGTGNDVAAALRNHAATVDAVELDPEILKLGRQLHPEQPYGDPRVDAHLNDARNFLRMNDRPFDLIVLGWLDSHRLFSSFSTVRQDNFVYTVEAAHQMRDLLTEDGTLCLSFYAGKPWIKRKILTMLTEAFGHQPRVFARPDGAYGPDGVIFLIARDPVNAERLTEVEGFVEVTESIAGSEPMQPPTDDWPYLYVQDHSLAWEYLSMMLVILVLSGIMVAPAFTGRSLRLDDTLHFFFLGAGFLLIEVRNITQLALVFGSTWATTSIVISGVLVMILMANILIEKSVLSGHDRVVWLCLFASIALSIVWSESWLAGAPITIRGGVTTVIVSSTFFFAAIVFAQSFRTVTVPSAALGANVLGAVVGGLLEYLSIAVGIPGLSVIAAILYACAMLTAWRRDRRIDRPQPESLAS